MLSRGALIRIVAIVTFTASMLLGLFAFSGAAGELSTVASLIALGLLIVASLAFVVPRRGARPR